MSSFQICKYYLRSLSGDHTIPDTICMFTSSCRRRTPPLTVIPAAPPSFRADLSPSLPIINIYHNIATSAHPGIANTLDRVKNKFYWYEMNQHVEKYIRTCHQCLKFKHGARSSCPPPNHTRSGTLSFCSCHDGHTDLWKI